MKDEEIYPCTIIADRYGGVYSGGKWTAFACDYDFVPPDVDADDVTCGNFWYKNQIPVGLGNTPQQAYEKLKESMKK